ncbi:MAG TPA: circularly permuted type 2 ATP-grasp protein, partial [Verrucomicrobiae bacterium]|nr:circularly permuted type 2 ATP-grasp protein [Verrucomicrobiae bacterium]
MSETMTSPQARPTSALLSAYHPTAEVFDELLSPDGRVLPHYANLIGMLEQLGPEEFQRRRNTSQWLVHEQGIIYNVYGDPRGMERPWQLDPIPFIIAPEEWLTIESGLIQRATLLNRILADCYGAKDLLRSGWLSPALVFAQPDFLRPCHGIRAPGNVFLHFYAADLARSPDGRWWVISDRAQIPTGAGYALANRLITSRILPELFRDNRVHRLAGFFREVQNSLAQLAPQQAEKARVVVLTPGPHNETYFEQAYLARYLGYLLVEGQDLTVRDDRVFLKTLSGLEPVDVILRRVDDDFCDPLELRNDSILGVPGLLEAWRAGKVAIANTLGSGLLQSPAFMSFLPGLCRHVLGEELKIPSVATWWCGQKPARQYVLEHLEELLVKPAFRTRAWKADPEKQLSSAERDALRRRIEFDPDVFVAQERVVLSTAPSWKENGLVPRPIGLRVYLVAGGGSYHVMPGGLARVTPDDSSGFISMQRGGSSKDTWVASETSVPEVTLLHTAGPNIELRRTGNNLPSRLADNFFWLGRYSERADATARLLRSSLLRFNPERTGSAMPLLTPLLQTLLVQRRLPGLCSKPELQQNPEAVEAELFAVIFDVGHPGSLRHTVDYLQRLAIFVRDRTSTDMWRVLSQLNERLATSATSPVVLASDAVSVLNQTLLGLAAFHGLARENMTRAQAWRFLDMGLRIERAFHLGTLLNVTLHSPKADDPSVLEAVLEVADSTITFRSRYNLLPHLPAVFDLVLLDDRNPRSVLFQINQLVQHFEYLPPERKNAPGSGKSILHDCVTRLNRTDARELADASHPWASSEICR